MRRALLLAIIIFFSSISLYAQDWHFEDESDIRLPNIETLANDLDGGDVNSDGSLELLVGCQPGFNSWPGFEQLFINDGAGYFPLADSGRFPFFNDLTMSVLLFDCNSDGYLDAYVGNDNYMSDYIAINDGTGYFTEDTLKITPDRLNVQSASYADIDGDGDIDICVLNNECFLNEPHAMWINDGTGHFHNENQRLPSLPSCYIVVEFGDINGDLKPDILTLDHSNLGRPVLLLNDGNGYFSDESDQRLPYTDSLVYRPTAKFIDVDDDGDLDIILASYTKCYFLINDGAGYFSFDQRSDRGVQYARCYIWNIKVADFNNDGLEDLILGSDGIQSHDYIFINIGNGYFEDQSSQRGLLQTDLSTKRVFAGDLDNDGDADIFRVGSGIAIPKIYINTLNSPDSIPPHIMNQTILPAIDTLEGPYPLKLMAKDGISIPYQLSIHVNYSSDGIIYQADSMHYTGAYIYYGFIPRVDSGETVYYYYTAEDHWHNISRVPSNAPDSVFSFTYLPGSVGIEEDRNQLPQKLIIGAYPNPFNSYTVISIKGINQAAISIYDITGRLVSSLKADNGKAIWNARGYSSGIYFARVKDGDRAQSIKLILLK